MHINLQAPFTTGLALTASNLAATCNLKASYTPIVANGWQAQLVAQGLSRPRSVLFDSNGHLLVVEAGSGISSLEFDDGGSTCLDIRKKTYLVNSTIASRLQFQCKTSANTI